MSPPSDRRPLVTAVHLSPPSTCHPRGRATPPPRLSHAHARPSQAPTSAGELPTFEFVHVPEDDELAAAGAELLTKHRLTATAPLPPSLVAYVRLERMNAVELTGYVANRTPT